MLRRPQDTRMMTAITAYKHEGAWISRDPRKSAEMPDGMDQRIEEVERAVTEIDVGIERAKLGCFCCIFE